MANMSFLPEDYLEKRIERRTNIICLTLFAVVSVAIVGAFYVTDRRRIEVRRHQQVVNQQFEDAAKLLTQLEQLQKRKADMIRKARVTAQLVERVPRTLILSELINNMPRRVSLLDLDLTTRITKKRQPRKTTALDVAKKKRKSKVDGNNAPVNEIVPVSQVEISLVGIAPTDVDVAKFMQAVGQSPLFSDVNLSFSEEVTMEQETLRKFQIDMKLRPQVDIHQIEPKMVRRPLKKNPMKLPVVAEVDTP